MAFRLASALACSLLLCLPGCGDDSKKEDKTGAKAGSQPVAKAGKRGKRGKKGKRRRGKGKRRHKRGHKGKGKSAAGGMLTLCQRVQCTDPQQEQIQPLIDDFRTQAEQDLKELDVAHAELGAVFRGQPFDPDALAAAFTKLDEQRAKMHVNASATLVSLQEILDGGQRILLAQGIEEVGPMRALDPTIHRRRVPPSHPPQLTDEDGNVEAYDADPEQGPDGDEPADAASVEAEGDDPGEPPPTADDADDADDEAAPS